MSKRAYHLENHPVHFAPHKLSTENYGLGNRQMWPLEWDHQADGEYFYTIRSGWKIIGTCRPPFPSYVAENSRAFIAENAEGKVYWWHFKPKTIVILPPS